MSTTDNPTAQTFLDVEFIGHVQKGHEADVELLLAAKPDTSFVFDGGTALMHAIALKPSDLALSMFHLLLPKSNPRDINDIGQDALMAAASNPSLFSDMIVEPLLRLCDPTREDDNGDTALILAAKRNNALAFEKLLPVSDLAAKNGRGENILQIALASGHLECLKLAIEHFEKNPSVFHEFQSKNGFGHLVPVFLHTVKTPRP